MGMTERPWHWSDFCVTYMEGTETKEMTAFEGLHERRRYGGD